MNLAGYPPQFAALLRAILKELPTMKIAQLSLYAGWEDSWERRDPTEEMFWDESLEQLFDRTTKSGFKRMRHETAELVVSVGDQIVGERMDEEKKP